MRYDIVCLGAIELARKASLHMANQIEDALAGLLINGVPARSINVQHHPDRTVIAVEGKPLYEFVIKFRYIDTHTEEEGS